MKKWTKRTIMVGILALVFSIDAPADVGVFSKKDKLISNFSLTNVDVYIRDFNYLGE